MNQQSLPPAAIRGAFETAGRIYEAARSPQGAARQIASASTPTNVERAIANAAQQTTVDFDFLVAQAQVESAMNPEARARTSSATGLYQFIESTWLGTMQRHGERFGLGDIAAQISLSPNGSVYVADPAARESILAMRSDPQVASLMAAGLAEDNRAHLAPILGREPDHGELYLAHFLGAGSAGRFLSAMADDPNQSAAALFRAPAAANRAIFYDRGGNPRSLAGVMSVLESKLDRALNNAPAGMSEGYAAATLNQPEFSRAPYLTSNDTVPGSRSRPVLSTISRPISGATTFALALPSSRGSMSGLIETTFGDPSQMPSAQSASQVRRAYDQLKALGL